MVSTIKPNKTSVIYSLVLWLYLLITVTVNVPQLFMANPATLLIKGMNIDWIAWFFDPNVIMVINIWRKKVIL